MEYTIFHLVLNWFQIMLSIFGFNTYEVEKDKVFQLMSIWKNILENELGIKIGDVLLADYKDYN